MRPGSFKNVTNKVFVDKTYQLRQRHLCKKVRTDNECLGYDIKQFDGETQVMLEPWKM